MRNMKSLALVFGMGLFLLLPTAKADDWDKLTKITFSAPVRIEKTELPAGTYTFKLMDLGGDRNVVQIFNADETHLIATILANPDYRMEPTGKTVVKFAESRNGSEASGNIPESGIAMKEWFYPGDSWGQEFPVKPVQVTTAQTETTETNTVATAEPAPAPPEATPEEAAPAPEPQAQTSTEPATQTPATAQTEQQTTTTESNPSELPQTASEMPLLGMMGLLALAGAASLRIFLKISA